MLFLQKKAMRATDKALEVLVIENDGIEMTDMIKAVVIDASKTDVEVNSTVYFHKSKLIEYDGQTFVFEDHLHLIK